MFIKESWIDFTSIRAVIKDHLNNLNGFLRGELGEMGPTVYPGVYVSLIQIDVHIIASYKNKNKMEGMKEGRKEGKKGGRRKDWRKEEGEEGREGGRNGGREEERNEGREKGQ